MTKEERIKNKIKQLYSNYGIDAEDISDEELSRLYGYYHLSEKKLDRHISESKNKIIKDEQS